MEDLPQEFLIENSSVKKEFLENKTGEITAVAYLLSITEIVNSCQQTGTGTLIIVKNYILGIIYGNDSIYLFDSHSKDENGYLSSSGTAVVLKFDTSHLLENYVQSVYYDAYPMTQYFQFQFIKVHRTVNAKSTVKFLLKKERLSAKRQKDFNLQKRKYHQHPKKRQAVKRRYDDKKESVKHYIKEKNVENRTSNIAYKMERKYHVNPEVRLLYSKCRYQENSEGKIIYQKARYQENCEKQIEYQKRRY